MMELLTSLEASGFGTWLRESGSIWAYPAVLTLHTMGLGVLVGASTVLDLRLLGCAPRIPLEPLERLFPIMWAGFWVNAISGIALFVADATTKGTTTVFMAKIAIVVVAILGAGANEDGRLWRRSWGRGHDSARTPAGRDLAGTVDRGDRDGQIHGLRLEERPMHVILDSFAVWLRSTSLSEAIRVLPWLWPVCEIVHFTGLSLLVGVVGFFDLRLLGLFARVPLNAAWSLMPWGKAGFGLAAITGLTFFIGAPDQYVTNVAFYAKLAFLAIAGLNAMSLKRSSARLWRRAMPAARRRWRSRPSGPCRSSAGFS